MAWFVRCTIVWLLGLVPRVDAASSKSMAVGDIILAQGGHSEYAIYCDEGSPPTVRSGALELQRILQVATGATLPITGTVKSRIISLGDNAGARALGLVTSDLPEDGFQIVTTNQDIFILGNDSAAVAGAGARPPSMGTLFGIYDFLERFVGVRWLMPGELGQDIPNLQRLAVPSINLIEWPDFIDRSIEYIQCGPAKPGLPAPEANSWSLHQRISPLGGRLSVNHGHAWSDFLSVANILTHPSYRAISGDRNKFCTSNPDAVKAFAAAVEQWLERHPNSESASISPTDGAGFCQCEKCARLVEKDAYGNRSYTPLILRFYNDVARIVGERFPNRLLGGLVYYNYMYPPVAPVVLQPNVRLAWAPLNYYGWGLQKPAYSDEFQQVTHSWAKLDANLVYHSYSLWLRSLNGAPIPPNFEILKLELPTLREAGIRRAEMVGIGAWGYGGPLNYILARQLWDSQADVEAIWRDWLERAYGPGWTAMDQLYRLIETRMKFRKSRESLVYRGEMYEINRSVMEEVYLPIFPKMESLYSNAMCKAKTVAQGKRLEMFGDNLIMLHYNLRRAKMGHVDNSSIFYRSDQDYRRFLEDRTTTIALQRVNGVPYGGPIWSGELRGE